MQGSFKGYLRISYKILGSKAILKVNFGLFLIPKFKSNYLCIFRGKILRTIFGHLSQKRAWK